MRGWRLLQTLKWLKHTSCVSSGNANALVANNDTHACRAVLSAERPRIARFQLDTSALWGIFDSIFYHIQQDLPEPVCIGPDWWQRSDYVTEELVFARRLLICPYLPKLADLAAQISHIYVRGAQSEPTMLYA